MLLSELKVEAFAPLRTLFLAFVLIESVFDAELLPKALLVNLDTTENQVAGHAPELIILNGVKGHHLERLLFFRALEDACCTYNCGC